MSCACRSRGTYSTHAFQFLRTKNPHLKYIIQMDDHRPLVASPANGPKVIRMADALAAVRARQTYGIAQRKHSRSLTPHSFCLHSAHHVH